MDFSDIPEVVECSSDDELIEDLEQDPEEDPELREHQLDHHAEDVELGISDNSFDSGEEPGDESDLDYDPSRDDWIDLYYMLTSQIDYFLSPHVYSIASWIDKFCAGYDIAYSQTGLFNYVDQSRHLLGIWRIQFIGVRQCLVRWLE